MRRVTNLGFGQVLALLQSLPVWTLFHGFAEASSVLFRVETTAPSKRDLYFDGCDVRRHRSEPSPWRPRAAPPAPPPARRPTAKW